MHRILSYLFAIALVISGSSEATIIETKDINDISKHIKKDTLVLFDIDNTVMVPCQELGTDQWFHHRIDIYQQAGLHPDDALEKALAEWMCVQNVTRVQLVQSGTDELIKRLQKNGYTIMGFTTRGLGLSTRTVQQLQSINVDFNATAPVDHDVFFDNGQGVLFRHGILFTAGSDKGAALEKFLKAIDMKPKSIVFINDKASHIAPVAKFCNKEKIPFTGLRYGLLDDRVANFRKDIAAVQLHHFGHILSDEQAGCVVQQICEAVGPGERPWQAE